MKRHLALIVEVGVVLALAGAGYYLWSLKRSSPAPPPVAVFSPAPEAPASAPAIHYPVPAIAPTSPKSASSPPPTLDSSDETVEQLLSGLLGRARFTALLNSKDLIRRFVVTAVNATDRNFPNELSPFKPPAGSFSVRADAGKLSIDPENFKRYEPYVSALKSVDSVRLVAAYVRYYSLFQSAYDDLGTKGYFNDRLVAAIDNCLATPEPAVSPALIQPTVRYRFADPSLESLSAAERLLLRMGPDQEKAVKAKLLEFRGLLTSLDRT